MMVGSSHVHSIQGPRGSFAWYFATYTPSLALILLEHPTS